MKNSPFIKLAGQKICRIFPSLLANILTQAGAKGIKVKKVGDRIDVMKLADRSMISISSLNAVYLIDMINYFAYYFSSCLSVEKEVGGIVFNVVDFSVPKFQKVLGFDDYPVMCPSLTEPYITARQYLDFANLQDKDVVLDLGAYSGLTAIAFARAVGGGGRVVAVEADPKNQWACEINFDQERRSCERTGAVIKLVKGAVSSDDGFLEFSAEGAMGGSSTDFVGKRGRVLRVPCFSLESLVEREGLSTIDFIKMDIEGSEIPVLKGAKSFFDKYRPKVIVEPHIINGNLNEKEVVGMLSSYGYECEVIEQFGVNLPLVIATPLV